MVVEYRATINLRKRLKIVEATIVNTNQNKSEISTIFRKGGTATIVAVVTNVALYVIGSTFTFPANAITPTGNPVTIAQVVFASILGGLAGTISYLLLTRFFSKVTTNRIIWILTGIVLVGMFFTPFKIKNAPVTQIIILEIMHLITTLPVWLLTRN